MTGKIVNLKTARKQRNRAKLRQTGDENAARHGQSKAETTLRQARADKALRDLDRHKREE